jgi:urease accessory protein
MTEARISISRSPIAVALVLAAASCSTSPALAHSAQGLSGGFAAGFLHPWLGMDHLLAMVAVGLWGAFLGRPMIAALPVIFPGVMAFGALLAILNVPLPPIEIGVAFSVLALGAAIAFGYRAPIWLAGLLTGMFGLFHGFAHGSEIPSLADPVAYSTGFVLATGSLHVAGIGLGMANRLSGGALAIRAVGAIISLTGVYFFAQAIVA